MSEQLAWVYRGPLAGRDFLLMEEDELEQAVADDWAQPVVGSGRGMFADGGLHPVEHGPHEAAELFAARRQRGERGYPTREMVAGPPRAPAPPEKVKPAAKADEDEAEKPAKKPTKPAAKK